MKKKIPNEKLKKYNFQKNKCNYGSKADRWFCEPKRSSSSCCNISSHSEKFAEITTTLRDVGAVPATVVHRVTVPGMNVTILVNLEYFISLYLLHVKFF